MTTAQKYYAYERYLLSRDVAWFPGTGWRTGMDYLNDFKLRGRPFWPRHWRTLRRI